MFLQIAPLFLAATLAMVLIAVIPPGVSGGTQFDVGIGQNRFFLGEHFLITFKDVIYWVAGMCMGLIFAMTFLFIGDIGGVLGAIKEKSSKRGGGSQPKEDTGATRDKRLIGSKKYPTHMEERVLSAIHTEPENYVGARSEQSTYRQGRLVGFPQLFPSVSEERMLEKVDSQPDNSFDQDDQDDKDEMDSEPSFGSKLFKILFSLPTRQTQDDSTESKLDINHFFKK